MPTDLWSVFRSGKPHEALEGYTRKLEEAKDPSSFTNRGLVLMSLGRYGEAEDDFSHAVALRGDSDGVYMCLGAAQWLAGEWTRAIQSWLGGLHTKYTDAAGGVELPGLLLFAALRTNDAGLERQSFRLLKRRWKGGGRGGWPAPIAGLHLGQVTADEVVPALSHQPVVRARQQCQLDFHLGVVAYRSSNVDDGLMHMQRAADNQVALLEVEHYLAMGELQTPGSKR